VDVEVLCTDGEGNSLKTHRFNFPLLTKRIDRGSNIVLTDILGDEGIA
jgi:hypothetical protein